MVSRWVFNCYVVHDRGDGRPMVVDLGLPSQVPAVRDVLRGFGADLADLGAAVATHGHIDHVAGLPALRDQVAVPVLLPRPIGAMLDGEAPLRSPGPRAMAQILPVLGDQPRDLRAAAELRPLLGQIGYDGRSIRFPVRAAAWLEDGDALPDAPGWQVLITPGHTDDSTCLFHADSGTLLSGDAVVSFAGGAWCNPEYVDRQRSAASEDRLRSLAVTTLLPGHGHPVTGPDVLGTAWSFDDRPPGSGKLRALWRIATDHARRHP